MTLDPRTVRSGAYGIGVTLEDQAALLVPVVEGWPVVEVVRRAGRVKPTQSRLDQHRASFTFDNGGGLLVEAESRRATFTTPEPLTDAELIHPYLAPVGASFAWWLGREAFHAGAFAVGDRVWALVGDKGSGKSSMLAWLAVGGSDIVCDDMLVVDEGMALAGPRCVDLRSFTAERLGVGELTMRPPDPRWRLPLGPVPPARRLAGWVFLEWDDAIRATPLAGSDHLPRLAPHRSMLVEPRDPVTLLELSALPAWTLGRPRDWTLMASVAECLLEVTASTDRTPT